MPGRVERLARPPPFPVPRRRTPGAAPRPQAQAQAGRSQGMPQGIPGPRYAQGMPWSQVPRYAPASWLPHPRARPHPLARRAYCAPGTRESGTPPGTHPGAPRLPPKAPPALPGREDVLDACDLGIWDLGDLVRGPGTGGDHGGTEERGVKGVVGSRYLVVGEGKIRGSTGVVR